MNNLMTGFALGAHRRMIRRRKACEWFARNAISLYYQDKKGGLFTGAFSEWKTGPNTERVIAKVGYNPIYKKDYKEWGL